MLSERGRGIKMADKTINQRITNTEIFVFNYDSKTKLYTYSRPFSAEEAELVAKETNQDIKSQYDNAKGLKEGLSAREGELFNMSALKGIVANKVLAKITDNQQWLPTIAEGVQLHKARMLPSGVLIDFGIALYDSEAPDREIAQALSATAREKGYSLPVLASFKSLDLAKGGERYAVSPKIISAEGLIVGDEARKFLEENFNWAGNSGVHGLGRGGDYGWDAGWCGHLDCFCKVCRVGRVSSLGTKEKLEQEAFGTSAPVRKSLDSVFEMADGVGD